MKFIQLTVIDRTTFQPDAPNRRVFVNPEQIVTMQTGYSIRGEKATGISLPLEGCNAMLFVAETPHQIIDLIEGDEEEDI